LKIAASPYVAWAFINAFFKRPYPRPTTPKTSLPGISFLKLFIPHTLILIGSIYALFQAYINEPIIWQTKGMKFFLCISIVSTTCLILTSTKWFINNCQRWKKRKDIIVDKEKSRIRNLIQRMQFQGTGIMDVGYNLNPRFQIAFDRCS
jgi:hypothetical protein